MSDDTARHAIKSVTSPGATTQWPDGDHIQNLAVGGIANEVVDARHARQILRLRT